MISGNHQHYQPPSQPHVFQHPQQPVVVIQQGHGISPYDAALGSRVMDQYGNPCRCKGCLAVGAVLLVVSVALFVVGILSVVGVFNEVFFPLPATIAVFSFGAMILIIGLIVCIPSMRYQMQKTNQYRQQMIGSSPSAGPDRVIFNPPSAPLYQPSNQPYFHQGPAFPPQPFQPFPPSTNPPPYVWSTPDPYSNSGFTSNGIHETNLVLNHPVHDTHLGSTDY